MRRKDSRERLAIVTDELDHILADIVHNRREHYLSAAKGPEAAVDVLETDTHLIVRVDLPGMTKTDIALSMTRDVLYVDANKRSPYPSDKRRFYNLERAFGRLSREIVIPKPVDARGIEATFTDGVLVVTMPKISDRRGERKPLAIR